MTPDELMWKYFIACSIICCIISIINMITTKNRDKFVNNFLLFFLSLIPPCAGMFVTIILFFGLLWLICAIPGWIFDSFKN